MELYILRHGIAVERGTPGFHNDFDRPLTEEGIKKVSQIVRALQPLDLCLDAIFSSPYVRARQTAELLAAGMESFTKQVKLLDALRADAQTVQAIVEALKTHGRKMESIVLVGHEPNLSSLVSLLISGAVQPCVLLKKGGICRLTVTSLRAGRCARLDWLATPRLLLRTG